MGGDVASTRSLASKTTRPTCEATGKLQAEDGLFLSLDTCGGDGEGADEARRQRRCSGDLLLGCGGRSRDG
jgi:hypothetical protein